MLWTLATIVFKNLKPVNKCRDTSHVFHMEATLFLGYRMGKNLYPIEKKGVRPIASHIKGLAD